MLADGEAGERPGVAGRRHDAATDTCVGRDAGHVVAVEPDRPAAHRRGARDRAEDGRLAGTVRAEQRDDLAVADGEIDAVQHAHAVVRHDQVADLEQRSARRRGRRGSSSGGDFGSGRVGGLVGQQARDRQTVAARDASEDRVAQVGERPAEPAGEDPEDEQQRDAGREDLPLLREVVVDAPDVRRAEDRAGDGAEAADHRHREDRQALLGPVRARGEAVLLVDEQRAGERGEEAGRGEREEGEAVRVHAERLARLLVVAHRDQRASRARASEPEHDGERDREPAEAHVVHAVLAAERHPEQVGAHDAVGGQPVEEVAGAEEAAVQQPRRRREREREARHRERQPAPAQRGQPDHERDAGADEAGDHDGGHEVPLEARGERARDGGADADERHLPEAHLTTEAGQQDERHPDDREHDDPRREVRAALA